MSGYTVMIWIFGCTMIAAEIIFLYAVLYSLNLIPTAFRALWSAKLDKLIGMIGSLVVIITNVLSLALASDPIQGNFYLKIEAILFIICVPFINCILIIRKLDALLAQSVGSSATAGKEERAETPASHLVFAKKLGFLLRIVVVLLVIALASLFFETCLYVEFHKSLTFEGRFDGCHIEPLMIMAPAIGIVLNALFLSKNQFEKSSQVKKVNDKKSSIKNTVSIAVETEPSRTGNLAVGATQIAKDALDNWNSIE